nr:DDB1- and CUL4-associated factor 10 homolog [Leptinotarsa decemlineata]
MYPPSIPYLSPLEAVPARSGIFNERFLVVRDIKKLPWRQEAVVVSAEAKLLHQHNLDYGELGEFQKSYGCFFGSLRRRGALGARGIYQSVTRISHLFVVWFKVKNIEWSTEDDVMVTSDFDGNIFSWNLKTANGNSLNYDKVFLMNGLMRMKLTEDGTKMIISTTTGFMIIIHDLNLSTLATDLRFFRPSLYRLMQLSEQCFPVGTVHNYLFSPTRKRNRIEFIDDFPQEAEAISSLQIHPHGWCAVSRNLNGDENQEYTTVHDIQTRDPKDYENAFTTVIVSGTDSSFSTYFRQCPEQRTRIIKNLPRMTHFIREKGVGKGFIKELCLSNDGRVIFSPYDKGVRLLGFNYKCQEMLMCIPDKPRQLKIVKEFANRHKDIVVSCKFSPVHHQLVSGCIVGDINWYQPVF